MRVEALELSGFRNLSPLTLSPAPGVNVIYGENGQGKTNLLEALWIFTGGRSFRGAKDGDLIRLHGDKASLSLCFFSEERQQELELRLGEGKRFVSLNGVKKRASSEIVGKFCAVIFSPEHLSLVKEGPSGRRQFLDSALCQSRPVYAGLLTRYNRTLFQRNALLKDIPRHPELLDTLEIWDMRLSQLGEEITRERLRYVEALEPAAASAYEGISGGREALGLSYRKGYEGSLSEALLRSRKEDVRFGHTAAGPHRGDLSISLAGVPARSFGSQGQQRSAVLALKLAETELLRRFTGEEPVILLDDVLSELDSHRQDYLLNHLEGRQVFLTCCSPEPARRLKEGKRFFVEAGNVQETPALTDEEAERKSPEEAGGL